MLSTGAGVGNLYEAVPERFLPAPSSMLFDKAMQDINVKNCNVCKTEYTPARVSTQCRNWYVFETPHDLLRDKIKFVITMIFVIIKHLIKHAIN
jgi:hypothetical protein